ncbi:phosphotransferase family protein [Streptomyces sp. H39-S7]|uniref:phosphotransferase family protein n=1 Tax=Streptomyces sp. H39-S7 TaxID=3004357 RepID=UPI0022AF2F80|nr:aminoglycoside phosphotransferase family protein [Streptomyces sp. H39-S7]MCZ4125426.1 aminoglycoside phosphotransferase family protein [Streptomyces sp. H39-S7]
MTLPALAAQHPPVELARVAFTQLTGEEVARIAPISTGWGHLSWKVATTSGVYLIKTGIRRPEQSDLFRQAAAQQMAAAAGVLTPQVVAIGEAGGPLQRPCYVQTWIPGTDGAAALALLDPARTARFGYALGQAAAVLHTVRGPRFAEDAAGTVTYPTWQAACLARLDRLTTATAKVDVLPPDVLLTVSGHLTALIEQLGGDVVPCLTHRDLYLPNTLAPHGCPDTAGLLDWEAAAFYDPIWDFVKLGMWVFDRHPQLRIPFLDGYTATGALPDGFDDRLTIYQGIEYLAAFPYFGAAWPDPVMLNGFRTLLGSWMDRHGLQGSRP